MAACCALTSCAACVDGGEPRAACSWRFVVGASHVGACSSAIATRVVLAERPLVAIQHAERCPSSFQVVLDGHCEAPIGALVALTLLFALYALCACLTRQTQRRACTSLVWAQAALAPGPRPTPPLDALVPDANLAALLKVASHHLNEPLLWVGIPFALYRSDAANRARRWALAAYFGSLLAAAGASLVLYAEELSMLIGSPSVAVVLYLTQIVLLAAAAVAAVVVWRHLLEGRRVRERWAFAMSPSHAIIVGHSPDADKPDISLAFDSDSLRQVVPIQHANHSRSFLFDLVQSSDVPPWDLAFKHLGFWQVHPLHAEIVEQMLCVVSSGKRIRLDAMSASSVFSDDPVALPKYQQADFW